MKPTGHFDAALLLKESDLNNMAAGLGEAAGTGALYGAGGAVVGTALGALRRAVAKMRGKRVADNDNMLTDALEGGGAGLSLGIGRSIINGMHQ